MRVLALAIVLCGSFCKARPATQRDIAATTAPTSTTCKTFAITSTPVSVKCDIGGTLKTPDPIGKPSKLVQNPSKALTICRARCLKNSNCLSFAVDETSSECILYMKTLIAQGIQQPKKDTGTVHYDRNCFTSTCSIVSTSTSTMSQTTTSSTAIGTPGCGSDPAPTFGLLVVGGSHDGLRGFLTGNDQIYNRQLQFTQYNSTPNQIFVLDAACQLTNDNGIAHTYLNATYTDFVFDSPAHIAASMNPPDVTAHCDTSSGYLSCTDQSENTLCLTTEAPNHIDIGPGLPAGGCEPITLKVLFM